MIQLSGPVLITGGGGYLGTALSSTLASRGTQVVRLGRPGSAFPVLPKTGQSRRVTELEGDVRARETWERAVGSVAVVFHLAAQTSARRADENLQEDFDANVRPMIHLVETCRSHGVQPYIVFASTVTVTGIPERLPVDETHVDRPITVYDLHKKIAEEYLLAFVERGEIHGCVLRLANVYGPGPPAGSVDRGILNRMIGKAIRGEELTIYGEGNHLRDYLYVSDAVTAFIAAAAGRERTRGRRFVVGTGIGHTVAEVFQLVADRVAHKTGHRVPVTYADPPEPLTPIESRDFVSDSTALRAAVGWMPEHSLVSGIDQTVEALR